MLLLPIKSKGLWAWNHREHGDCASQGKCSREAALLERQKGRGSWGWEWGEPQNTAQSWP